jgi:hypothetical protein
VPDMILAASVSDNAPAGAILTFAFPVILFAVIAIVLYLLFSRPHRRIPSQRVVLASSTGAMPEPEAARGAAVAAGLPTAAGGGSTESPAEAPGAQREHADAAERGEAAPGGGRHAAQPGNGSQSGTGNVSGETHGSGGTGGYGQGTQGPGPGTETPGTETPGTEGSE